MRVARLKENGKRACYHVVSRVVDRQRVLGAEEKTQLRHFMRAVESFSGINVLTFAIMDDHFHLLLELPEPEPISDEDLPLRLAHLYEADKIQSIVEEIHGYRQEGDEVAADHVKSCYTCRMYELSEFVKTLKQKYTQWHNKRRARRGTLWESRFKSVMIQPERAHEGQWDNALVTMAAYIDLNAVRAGIVTDPGDYRYCGFGEACEGGREARDGIARLFDSYGLTTRQWKTINGLYRKYILDQDETPNGKDTFSPDRVNAVLDNDGKLTLAQTLRCRVRYFSDGAVLGSKSYVEDVFQRNREQFGVKRKNGARALRQIEAGSLCTMRDLRLEPILPPHASPITGD